LSGLERGTGGGHVPVAWRVTVVDPRTELLHRKERAAMSERLSTATGAPPHGRAPWWVTLFNPITRPLLAAGLPLGFNGLLTVRGRTTGLPRTTPLAIIDVDGRQWIWSPWGEVQWVRNLRAAGHGTITVRGRPAEVRATELDPTERVRFFRDVLAPVARGIPFGSRFIRAVDGVDLADPVGAADGRVVFELHRER
jgi:deazaflavin-dependent oxidoreductase (nitroreductase family)